MNTRHRLGLLLTTALLLAAGALGLPVSAQNPPAVAAAHRLYLPLLLTPGTPAAIGNGDFEQGRAVWSEASSAGYSLIFSSGFRVAPHSGQFLAWLGGADAEASTLAQSLSLAPGGPQYLHYHYLVDSREANCTFDRARVLVGATVVAEHALCISNNSEGWARRSLDLSGYAGQRVTISFQVSTDESVVSSLFIDDVSLQAGP